MKKYRKSPIIFTLLLIFTVFTAGCGQRGNESTQNSTQSAADTITSNNENSQSEDVEESTSGDEPVTPQELEVHFGDEGKAFLMHLYDNDTASAIARHVGTSDWRLPIYHYDDYENYEVMQYYDIPERYEIPSDPEHVTSEKAGEVYYSHPNRIVLFYGDAEVTGAYTRIGYFDATDEFQTAVQDNPVLEGWDNKIVLINSVN